jgi:transketolase
MGAVIAIDRFGASAPGDVVMREYGFTVEAVVEKALDVLQSCRPPRTPPAPQDSLGPVMGA